MFAAACGARSSHRTPDAGGVVQSDAGNDSGVGEADAAPSCAANDDEVGDGIDQNCDGIDGEDHDVDGFASTESGGTDCDDGRADVNPGAAELPGSSAIIDEGPGVWLEDAARGGDGTLGVLFASNGGTTLGRLGETGWSFEYLGVERIRGGRIAPDSTIHFAYWCDSGLCYATTATGSWIEETVDSEVRSDLGTICMDFEEPSNPAIAYGDRGDALSPRLLVGRRVSGSWVVEEVAIGVNGWVQCVVDPAGALHLIFKNIGANAPIMYGTDATGRWEVSSTATTTPGYEGTMAVDASGTPHLIVATWGLEAEYRTNRSGVWVGEPLPEYVGFGLEALTAGTDGSVHLLGWPSVKSSVSVYAYYVRRDATWSTLAIIEVTMGWQSHLFVDRGMEIVDVYHFPDPADPGCFECDETTQLRYTGPGIFDENCDGVAE